MAAYGTPDYTYTHGVNELTRKKGLQDAASAYGNFLGQERFRRSNEAAGQQFQRGFPQVGAGFNHRGLWNSGLRQQGQQQYVGDFQTQQDNAAYDEAARQQQYNMGQTAGNSDYAAALQDYYQQLVAARAAQNNFDTVAPALGL